jgi:hypothetical protein
MDTVNNSNVDETALLEMDAMADLHHERKKMASGFKASKNRLTLLLGVNANRDFKLKPLLV